MIGGSVASEDVYAVAEEVGRRIGEAGAYLVCGGHGGVMEAACKGARSAGGITIGILGETDRRFGNEFLTVSIPTGIGEVRNTLVVQASQVLIAIDGEFGTLSEISFALKVGIPVIGVDTWGLTKSGAAVDDAIHQASTPEEAVGLALSLVSR